jgi:hypothetical protein
VFARTGLRLTDIVWTGHQFLYVDNTTNRIAAAGPSGMPRHAFAAMPRQVEETRCAVSPGRHGFTGGALYCHAPNNVIYRISADGRHVTRFATVPHMPRSDGAIAFDRVGAFGYALLVATGRSGGPTPAGGAVFSIDPSAHVRLVGRYAAAGGADEIAVAPAHFGALAGQVLLVVDAGHRGRLIAMDAQGRSRTLLTVADGPNPIAVLTPGYGAPTGAAQPGLYVTDTLSHDVYLAPAAELQPYVGHLIVGSELRGSFWVIEAHGTGVVARPLATTLTSKHYNLEGAIYLAPS